VTCTEGILRYTNTQRTAPRYSTRQSYIAVYFSSFFIPSLLLFSISQSYFLVEYSLPITRLNLPCPIFGAFLIHIHVLSRQDRILHCVTLLSALCVCNAFYVIPLSLHLDYFSSLFFIFFHQALFPLVSSLINTTLSIVVRLFLLFPEYYPHTNRALDNKLQPALRKGR
jgi:hypothetical protein